MRKTHIKAICLAVMFITIFINLIFLFYPLYHGSLWGTYTGEVEGKRVEISFDGITYQMSTADISRSHGVYHYRGGVEGSEGHYAIIALENKTTWGMGNIFSITSTGYEDYYKLYNTGAIAIQVVMSVITIASFSVFVFIKSKEY